MLASWVGDKSVFSSGRRLRHRPAGQTRQLPKIMTPTSRFVFSRRLVVTATAVTALAFGSVARATLLFSQDFESLNTGDLVSQGGFFGTDINVGLYDVVSTGVSYAAGVGDTPIAIDGGSKGFSIAPPTTGERFIYVPLGSSSSADEVWLSMTLNTANFDSTDFSRSRWVGLRPARGTPIFSKTR